MRLKSKIKLLIIVIIINSAGLISELKAYIPIICHGDEICLMGRWVIYDCDAIACLGDMELNRTCPRCRIQGG